MRMSRAQPRTTMPFPEDAETQRPRCPACDMRMITVREPTAKFECLRCGHSEMVVAQDL
jgi:predicted RNA-binding Zn-ribbon protein involved in translation (DUF1610 family)